MKQLLTLTATLLVSAFAMAAYPIEGTWGTTQTQNGFDLQLTFAVQNNSVTVTNKCSYKGESAEAHVTVPATYDDKSLTITEKGSNAATIAGVNCDATIVPMKLNYAVSGTKLTLTKDGSTEQLILDWQQ